jgi:tetratricopeptide (TPR) repeat protein
MSHINDALKKAQKERDARYLRYGAALAMIGKEKGLFRSRIVWCSLFLFIIFLVAFVSYSSLDSRDRQTPVTIELQHNEQPTPAPKPEGIDNAKALYESARDFHRRGRLLRARRLYEETLRLDPSYVDALNNLGVIYIHEKDFSAAQKSFEEAIRLNPGYVDPYYNLACLFAIKGDRKESLTHLRKAVSLEKEVRDWAREDSDLDNLRAEPEFEEIVGSKGRKETVEELFGAKGMVNR